MRPTVFIQPSEVTVGEPITSRDWNAVAEALASRLELFGGLPEAVVIWFHYVLRNLVAAYPEGLALTDGVFLDPDETWFPLISGQSGNPLVGLIEGNPNAIPYALDSEADRLAGIEAGLPEDSPRQLWDHGFQQAGVIDPDTGEGVAPAVTAALTHEFMWFPPRGIIGLSYGGFAPTDAVIGECTDGSDEVPPSVKRRIVYRRISDGFTKTYETCPNVVGDMWGEVELNDRWLVWAVTVVDPLATTTVTYLKSDWLRVPGNSPGVLVHQQGGHVPRLMAAYAQEFAGDVSQREVETRSSLEMRSSYQFGDVATRPFYLAPCRGLASGPPEARVVTLVRPTFRWSGTETLPAGTYGTLVAGGGSSHATHGQCHWTGFFVEATNLAAPVTLQGTCNGAVVGSMAVTPDGTGAFGDVRMLAAGQTGNIAWQALGPVSFGDGGGTLDVECREQAVLKPEIRDLAAVLLRGATG